MSDKSKFEQMLEKLVADDKTAAEEIFHNIVVEKSRSIYEGLLENDIKDIEVEETSKEDESKKDDDAVDEASKDESKEDDAVDEASKDESKEDEAVEEASKDEETTDESLLDIENTEIAPVEAHGGDATDDMVADIGMPAPTGDEDNGDDSEKGEEEIEDRVVDLEDAIDDLKAEFEKMMGDEDKSDDAEGDDAEDNGEEKEDEAFVDQSAEGETAIAVAPELGEQPAVETAEPKTASEEIREYVNKVGVTHTDGSDNSKSPVAGKNDMGGTASNIAKGGEEKGSKAPAPKEDNAGNINVPGAKAKPVAAPKAKTSTEDDTSAKSIIGS
tara:strand:+ start:2863 stop:3849 length:987 start_codon:yes stop_codon:yes gene_type:complete